MLDKKNFFINLSITQGRHLKIMNNQIQLFPEKSWKKELKIFKKTKLKYKFNRISSNFVFIDRSKK